MSRRLMEMGYKALREAVTNPLADPNPLRTPAQSTDPNRGLGLITMRMR
tara:strand:- start:8996 stop:9142 length:147 start_codon:yes stop_codon:yes gene_type:complete